MIQLVSTLLWLNAVGAQPVEPPSPFAALSFDEAVKAAGAGRRLLLIHFVEQGSADCAKMRETTWRDAAVRAWMAGRTVAIECDIAEYKRLAERHGIRSTPAVVVLTPNGTVRAQVSGFREPPVLLEALKRSIEESDPVAAAKSLLDASPPGQAPAARRAYAHALTEAGDYGESLVHLRKCFEADRGKKELQQGARLLIVEDLGALARRYRPARDALTEIGAAARARIESGGTDRADPALFAAVNTQLGDADDTLALYRKLQDSAPTGMITLLLRESAIESLRKLKRYDAIGTLVDIGQRATLTYEQHRRTAQHPAPAAGREDDFQAFLVRQFVGQMATYYEILIGAGRQTEAEQVAQLVLSVDATADTYAALASAGLQTGKPIEANVEQALRVLKLWENPTFADVRLAVELLLALNRREEAAETVRTHAAALADPGERAAIEALLHAGGSPDRKHTAGEDMAGKADPSDAGDDPAVDDPGAVTEPPPAADSAKKPGGDDG